MKPTAVAGRMLAVRPLDILTFPARAGDVDPCTNSTGIGRNARQRSGGTGDRLMIATARQVPPPRLRVANRKGRVTFLVLPRGLRGAALAMLLGGLAAAAIFGGLVLFALRDDRLQGNLRIVGAVAMGVAGLCSL